MLSSINPLGERARGQRFQFTAGWYLFGSLLGGAAMGTVFGIAGSFLPAGDWRLLLATVALVVGAALDGMGWSPPSVHRQVDENWLSRYRGWVYGIGFGFQLGFGVVTIVTSASVYSVVALVLLSGSLQVGLLLGVVFGLARAVVILRVADASDPARLRVVMRRLQERLTFARVGVVGAQLIVAVLLIGTL